MNRATCWIVSRRDGVALGFTDHDDRLMVDGVACSPNSGVLPAASDSRLGFGADTGAVRGALDDARITARDISDGVYDGAVLRTYSVDWRSTDATLERTHRITTLSYTSANVFTAELVGLTADLDRVAGRVVSRLCSARFGDTACGLSLADFPDGTVCPRSFEACKGFSNVANFRGFPHLIGDDALVVGPHASQARDGGSRYHA